MAALRQKATRPTCGESPSSNAAAAPGKPTWDSVWLAKLCPRSTTK